MSRARWCTAVLAALAACSKSETPQQETPFVPRATIASVGADPLAAKGLESCPVLDEERCANRVLQRCSVHDGTRFTATPDPLLQRVLRYDRWYDLYASPLGLTMERRFDGPMPAATPEEEWGSRRRFSGWDGAGDSAIWTGVAATSDIFRYAVTRTEADYQRMERRIRALVTDFEVTGVPGYLARYHFLLVPRTATVTDQLILRRGDDDSVLGKVDIPFRTNDVPNTPDVYRSGMGRPHWNGDPSIDQYTGPMVAFPLAYPLLRDAALKERMVHHLTCYLKRLQRIEVVNLKARTDLLAEIRDFFGGSGLELDPGDPDLTQVDHLIFYVHPGMNRDNWQTFDTTCPAGVQIAPSRVIDARSESFELDMLELSGQINRSNRRGPKQIDHFYIPNLRGGDASHLIHLAALSYWFTGDEQYRRFLFDELIGNIGADAVARTMMAYRLPDWCFRFYGDHITYGTHWQLINLLPEGELRDLMIKVMEEEVWQKAMQNHKNAKANVMYASTVPAEIATGRDRALAELRSQLRAFGGNGGVDDNPRRTFNRSRQSIIDQLPTGTTIRCPTEQERTACEQQLTLLGFPLETSIISRECDGRAGECRLADGKCADGLASEGLPVPLRAYADFMWQRSPFQIGESHGADGQTQSPGRDLSEPYWMSRYYGFITEGADQALAWQEVGTCN